MSLNNMSLNNPVRATFRHLLPSDELMTHIRREAEHLCAQHPAVRDVAATIELPNRSRRSGRVFRARVQLAVSGAALIAKSQAGDPHDALRRAFRAAERNVNHTLGRRREARSRGGRTHSDEMTDA